MKKLLKIISNIGDCVNSEQYETLFDELELEYENSKTFSQSDIDELKIALRRSEEKLTFLQQPNVIYLEDIGKNEFIDCDGNIYTNQDPHGDNINIIIKIK
jgi:hypothetical protein